MTYIRKLITLGYTEAEAYDIWDAALSLVMETALSPDIAVYRVLSAAEVPDMVLREFRSIYE